MTSSSGVRSAPVASGTLSGIPLAHALVYIRNKKLSGVLELRASADRHASLVFWRGLVVASMTTPTVARFGTVVYELGLIDGATLDETTVASATTKRPQMDILVERGLITASQRADVLTEQVKRRVHHLFTLPPATTFTFREGRPSTTEPSVAVDILGPVWRGLCDFPPDARASEVLSRVGAHPMRLVSESVIERAELTPDEVALCASLAGSPLTREQLKRKSATIAPARIDLLVYLLVITRCVEVDGAERAPLPSGAMWAKVHVTPSPICAPVATTSSDGEARTESAPEAAPAAPTKSQKMTAVALRGPVDLGVEGIQRRARGLATESPFATLGLAEGASSEAARAAYFRLGRLWNPDRLPPELEAAREAALRIYGHMTQAHRLLTDPAARPALVSSTAARADRQDR